MYLASWKGKLQTYIIQSKKSFCMDEHGTDVSSLTKKPGPLSVAFRGRSCTYCICTQVWICVLPTVSHNLPGVVMGAKVSPIALPQTARHSKGRQQGMDGIRGQQPQNTGMFLVVLVFTFFSHNGEHPEMEMGIFFILCSK